MGIFVTNDQGRACNCVGPNPGETKCPCMLADQTAEQAELAALRKQVQALQRNVAMNAIIN